MGGFSFWHTPPGEMEALFVIVTALLLAAATALGYASGTARGARHHLLDLKRRERRRERLVAQLTARLTEKAGLGSLGPRPVPPHQEKDPNATPARRVVPASESVDRVIAKDQQTASSFPKQVPTKTGGREFLAAVNQALPTNGNNHDTTKEK